jgi:dienelactone hydrolase
VPPLQAVLYFPGSGVIQSRTLPSARYTQQIDFLVKSGRAVIFPMLKGTLERGDDLTSDYPDISTSYRDHVIAWSKDVGRSLDYLETRPEIARSKFAYYGTSWGGAMGPIMTAVEPRFKANVWMVPGFYLQKAPPEVDQFNFAPRVKIPTLMLNGRYDFLYPIDDAQVPLFRLLGAPADQKRRVVYETGHNIPRNELIKEAVDWLDHYLGPVQ